jgi:hypothetical protein
MIIFGAPYYCLELYIAYTGRQPTDLILALAGGAAVAPSSLDPWIFLLFWVNWGESTTASNSRRFIALNLQQQHHCIQPRRANRSNILGASSVSDQHQQHQNFPPNAARLSPSTTQLNASLRKLGTF